MVLGSCESSDPVAIQVIGLGLGDCGKGSIVDFLTRRHSARVVVRFNGGPQAGHNVLTADATRSHTFSQFGSGSLVPAVRTVLSRFMLIEPYAMFNEARHLQSLGVADVWSRLLIDRRCAVITPAHQAANRLRELARGNAAHGTCGMGIGETAQDLLHHPDLVPRACELSDRQVIGRKLHGSCDLKAELLRDIIASQRGHPNADFAIDTLTDRTWIEAAVDNYAELARRATIASERAIASALNVSGAVIFEGAQGVLLDENFGFHPHTTWSTTTFANADAVLDEIRHTGRRYRLGVMRAYFTRHGPGPFVTEDDSLGPRLPEPHNVSTGWQGRFRTGLFDAVAARYALAVAGGVDGLAINHLDRLPAVGYRMCRAYCDDGAAPGDADYFVRDRGQITDLRVHRPASFAHQARLTQLLSRCRPADTHPAGDNVPSFIREVQRQVGFRVVLTSRGPNARDKKVSQ
jgi:adenylosuccinate synthase